jgi:hypothetical protein
MRAHGSGRKVFSDEMAMAVHYRMRHRDEQIQPDHSVTIRYDVKRKSDLEPQEPPEQREEEEDMETMPLNFHK